MEFSELLRMPLSELGILHRTELCRNLLPPARSDIVCEIGPGNGLAGFVLSGLCRRVVAIDISEPLIEFLSNNPHPDNLEFYAIDATKNPPNDFRARFDKCICMDVMEHAEDPPGLLKFISQILKAGGSAVITFPINNLHHGRNFFTRDSLLELVAKSDLKMDIRFVRLDRLGWLLENIPYKFQSVLSNSSKAESDEDEFDSTACFQMLQKPKRMYSLYKLAITLLFKVHVNPFYDSEAGDRALIIAKKV